MTTPLDLSPTALAEATADRRTTLARRIRYLVSFTITYNLLEAVVSLLAGSDAGSSALLGFGLDSVIEVSSALAVAWQFAGRDHGKRERIALRAIALSFFALAVFLGYDSLNGLVGGHAARHSTLGIGVAALSLLVMPTASYLQRRSGRELGSVSAVADSKQTLLCTYMSAVLLVGLLANSLAGCWWADPLAALLIAGLALREGVNAWRGDTCCAPSGSLVVLGRTGATSHRDAESASSCGSGPNCGCCA